MIAGFIAQNPERILDAVLVAVHARSVARTESSGKALTDQLRQRMLNDCFTRPIPARPWEMHCGQKQHPKFGSDFVR